MLLFLGQLAALGTSLSWSVTSLFFSAAARQVGSSVVNRMRLLVALAFVLVSHLVFVGRVFPFDAEPFRFQWLIFSGLVGFLIGDGLLFQAYVLIGPRLSMLMMSLAPVFAALMGLGFLGEKLTVAEWGGIALTVAGVGMVVTERAESQPGAEPTDIDSISLVGVLLGVGAAMGQAGGLLASKVGLAGAFHPLSGNAIRLSAATVAMWLATFVRGKTRSSFDSLREKPIAVRGILAGALTGPVIGVTLSLFAVQNAPVGVASTLMSLSPVILLPVDRMLYGSHIGLRAVSGTVLAFVGTALLFLKF